MQRRSNASSGAEVTHADCVFCEQNGIAQYILKETPTFRIVTDHAPLVEGHLLIMPKEHYSCYGDMPAELDEELFGLKREVRQFLEQFYDQAIFWEHGIFRQTVFHAHLHCFPFGETKYDITAGLHKQIITSQDELRAWHRAHGHYFYLEDSHNALLFPAEMEPYQRIIREVLWSPAAARNGHSGWRSAQQRIEEGRSLIQATVAKWQTFQQREVSSSYTCVNDTTPHSHT